MIFSKKNFHRSVGTTRTVKYNPENSTLFSNNSLSRNKQPLTYTVGADDGFYFNNWVFSVRCELNGMVNCLLTYSMEQSLS